METATSQKSEPKPETGKPLPDISDTPPPTTVEAPPVKKPVVTWERSIEILKLLATVWVALVGTLVTMQFNERQHELNRIEAIAKMLPHIASKQSPTAGTDGGAIPINSGLPAEHDMARDGAIWAIFRTANNRTMLRDMASLFPEDIYRVVSSIAISGQLDHDADAITALQISSEKLAAKLSADPANAELAGRLYTQALRLKERKENDDSPLHVVDLTSPHENATTSDEQLAHLMKSMNDLAVLHSNELESGKHSSGSGWQSKELYQRSRKVGLGVKDTQVRLQVIRADLGLSAIYIKLNLLEDAVSFLKEARHLESDVLGKANHDDNLKYLDSDADGFADAAEIKRGITDAQERFKQLEQKFPATGVPVG